MTSSSYLRYPHVHEDLLTFVAEDDVWVAPVTGGRAWRISALALPARNPRFSPDGSQIAWTVIVGNAPEVVCAAVNGGDFRQLTYWGHPSTKVKGFTADGDVLATSSFEREESRHTWAYRVPLDGGPATILAYGPVDAVAFGPEAGDERPVVVSSVLSREPAWWKRYRGGTAGKLWIDRDGSGEFVRLVPELDGNLADPLWLAGRIGFLSDHEGYGNVYSVRSTGEDLRRHTDQTDFYVRHASSDGRRVIYESAGALWLLDGLDADPVQLAISLGSASVARRPAVLKVDRHLGEVTPDATGRTSLVESHGTVHLLTHRDGPARAVEATDGVRARLARFVNSGRPGTDHGQPDLRQADQRQAPATNRVLYVADHDGNEALYVKNLDAAGIGAIEGRTQRVRIGLDGIGRVSELATSPDGRLAAVGTEFGEVLVADIESGSMRSVCSTPHGAIRELVFSADSAWLAWVEPVTGEGARTKLRLVRAGGTEPDIIDITDGRFRDHSPAFTPDGRFIAFLSERSFDPVYDTHRFDLSFPSSTKPFLVALAATTASPFGPSVEGSDVADPAAAPAAGRGGSAVKAAESGTDVGTTAAPVVVDREHIGERIIGVPVPQGSYDKLTATDGALLWLAAEIYGVTGDGRAAATDEEPARRLERFDLAQRKVTVLVPELDGYRLSGDGKRVVAVHGGEIHVRPTAVKVEDDDPAHITVDTSRIRVLLSPLKVWGQAFDEAWRLQRDFYWTPDMAGIDWQGVYERYRPLVETLGSHDDLMDLLWELHGELGTSHAYVSPAPVTEPDAGGQGRLGADLVRGDRGWEVIRILAAESSDPLAGSPLTAPGAAVKVGDVILGVDGREVPAGIGPAPLLAGSAGKIVELHVLNGPGHGAEAGTTRRIAVVPVADEERLRYQNWVAANRALVRKGSHGAYGYLHIPDMVARGWSQLHRDLDVETARDALIIDVRANRGGHTSQLVAELIARKVTAWGLPRGEEPGTYPAHSPRGPVVILTDEFAGSDGDIITQIAKLRSIGPVVGTRTWGGVVGIDMRFTLADGTGVTQPRYATWFTGGVGWGVENYGVDPDIEVPFPPHAHGAGTDPQLERAVGVLEEMLTGQPTAHPPELAGYPSRRPGPLPPRPEPAPGG